MAYTKTVWQDRQVTFPLRFTQTLVSGTTYDLVPAEGTVIQSGTPINATNMNKIENGIETLDTGKFDKTGGTMTGDLTITKTYPAVVLFDTDALGVQMAITSYQSKLSFRWGANSTTNEMMYIDAVTGLSFRPNIAFTGASTIGQSGIHMKNSDIVGVNGIYLNDEAQAEGEGFNFPKTGISGSSTTQSDYNCLRVDGTGRMKLGGSVVASVEVGTRVDNLGATPKLMMAAQTVTCSVGIADCPNGWMLEWRDESGTAFLTYEPIYKHQSQGSSTMYRAGSSAVGSNFQKVLSHSNTVITGSDSNDDVGAGGALGSGNARVLSAVRVF